MKSTTVLSVLLIAGALSGCATTAYQGAFFSKNKSPLGATAETGATKMGQACATSILGLVSFGDGSIEAAKANGGIAKVSSVDQDNFGVLGAYYRSCTVVKGT